MAIKIYVDVLFLTNLIFDFVLLFFTTFFAKKVAKPLKILLASAVGGALAVISFFFVRNTIVSVIAQFFVAFIMVAITFGKRIFFERVRLSAVLYVTAFTLAGVCMLLVKNNGFIAKGGIIYFDISMYKLLLAGFFTYILSLIFYGVVQKENIDEREFVNVTVCNSGIKNELKGFVDTGNILKDENGRGVIFANRELFYNCLNDNDKSVIFVNTIGGKTCCIAFCPDEISYLSKCGRKVLTEKRKIALTDTKISDDFELLLPSDFYF